MSRVRSVSAALVRAAERALSVYHIPGLVPYRSALALQEDLAEKRHAGIISDTLLVLQHPPVFTIGKRPNFHNITSSEKDLEKLGAEVHHINRGGDVTWHGPGQAVLYPIVNVRDLGVGARRYVEGLEDVMVNTAAEYGVHAEGHKHGETGVWVGDRKIGACGVRISRGISSHGIAFNVNPELTWFSHIVPCGIADKGVTSLAQELGRKPDYDACEEALSQAFATIFEYQEVTKYHNSAGYLQRLCGLPSPIVSSSHNNER
mmetsp:Transcript_3358/g.6979  ORF Transcript_3358/g.6979 Transcript_3358/m.6979 type:complete len:261 (-) Transcript_3358:85-867(-)|eukprot:CAMPEP_0118929406 /NCGR_PEP_ID=MMETSP1169-20130426/6419_1 /TAXON_ID=36882 /ORGANISM="Pyramimonas obovata, Strain CCMP722" /LENGTH=260 /DNA_ID=CAMNT_0006871597 /DNA_START=231 /DNA_END=1013 /DNA_ORIENTATION=-